MNLPQFFCRHQYRTVAESQQTVRRAASPKPDNTYAALAERQMFVTKSTPIEFYDLVLTTRVMICEKCGHPQILKY